MCRVLRAGSTALRERLLTRLLGVHEDGHVAVRVLVHVHELMALARLRKLEDTGQAWVDLAGDDEVVDALRLLVVCEMRALEALLLHPVITQVERSLVPGRARADHDHPAGLAHEPRG